MTADVIDFPAPTTRNPGNGAREALIAVSMMPAPDDVCGVDWLLGQLWLLGFKVVPLDGSEPAA